MVHIHVIWTEGPDGNIAHLAENNVSPAEAEEVLREPSQRTSSRSTGRPLVLGFTRAGRRLVVVYDIIDAATVLPVTAYDVD